MHRQLERLRLHVVRRVLRTIFRPTSRDGLVRIGTDYGGWWLPEEVVKAGAVAYCAGAGEDISFDVALVERGCDVTTFDPTPRAIAYVEGLQPIGTNFRFLPVGWWGEEKELRFYAPADSRHVSHSAVNLQKTDEFFSAQAKPVHQFMSDLGDEKVDIVKMDIEGAEYSVIEGMIANGPTPKVLCVEFDQPQPVRKTVQAVRDLRAAGYSLVKVDRFNFSFVSAELTN